MRTFREASHAHFRVNLPQGFLLFSLLVAALLWSSGCAGVVSGGGAAQVKPAALLISVSSLPNGTAQKTYSASLAATGGTAPYGWSVTQGSLPAGISISGSGQISGTPTQAGTFTFTVTATDSSVPTKTATASLSITVAAGTTPVQVTTSSLPSGQVSVAYSSSLAGSGGVSPYSWSISSGSLPAGLTLNSSSGAITGTPSQAGSSAFTVQLSDSSIPAQTVLANFTIAVTAANQPVSITTSSLPAGETSSAYTATLTASGGIAPYSWSVASGALPTGLALSSAGTISGTPSQNGNFSFSVQVKDSSSPVGTATESLSISIALAGGTLQVTTPSLGPGQANVAYSTTLTAIGGTKPYSWSVSAGALPAGLALSAASGIISGTPTQSGTFSFTVQVQDASATPQTATKPLSIAVASAVPPLQLTTTSLINGQVNSPYGATLSANGGTTPYSWSVSSGSLPAGLALSAATGQISGTPMTSGTASFTVKVTDSSSPAKTANCEP